MKRVRTIAVCLLVACTARDSEYRCGSLAQPGPDGDVPSGYEFCATREGPGFVHRAAAVDVAIDPTKKENDFCSDGHSSGCTSNAACDDGSVCELEWWGECRCAAKCRSDSDCGEGLVCVPTILPDAKGFGAMAGDNECRPSLCLSDADCASGFCVLWEAPCGTVGGTRCFEEEDDCRTTADCADPEAVCRPLDGPFGCDDAGETCD